MDQIRVKNHIDRSIIRKITADNFNKEIMVQLSVPHARLTVYTNGVVEYELHDPGWHFYGDSSSGKFLYYLAMVSQSSIRDQWVRNYRSKIESNHKAQQIVEELFEKEKQNPKALEYLAEDLAGGVQCLRHGICKWDILEDCEAIAEHLKEFSFIQDWIKNKDNPELAEYILKQEVQNSSLPGLEDVSTDVVYRKAKSKLIDIASEIVSSYSTPADMVSYWGVDSSKKEYEEVLELLENIMWELVADNILKYNQEIIKHLDEEYFSEKKEAGYHLEIPYYEEDIMKRKGTIKEIKSFILGEYKYSLQSDSDREAPYTVVITPLHTEGLWDWDYKDFNTLKEAKEFLKDEIKPLIYECLFEKAEDEEKDFCDYILENKGRLDDIITQLDHDLGYIPEDLRLNIEKDIIQNCLNKKKEAGYHLEIPHYEETIPNDLLDVDENQILFDHVEKTLEQIFKTLPELKERVDSAQEITDELKTEMEAIYTLLTLSSIDLLPNSFFPTRNGYTLHDYENILEEVKEAKEQNNLENFKKAVDEAIRILYSVLDDIKEVTMQ